MELFPLGIIYFLWIGGINEADATLILIIVSPKQLQRFPGIDPDFTGVNEVRIWLTVLTSAKRQIAEKKKICAGWETSVVSR